jgi:malate synthase
MMNNRGFIGNQITPMAKPNVVDPNRIPGRIQEAVEPQYRIRDQLKRDFQGLGSLKDRVVNSATGLWDKIGGGVETIMDNTLIGRIAAMNDATNPRAWNYNPKLQGQIDYLKEQGKYGVMDQSGLNKITGGVLAGKNLQSMFGSNDLGTMYDKSIAQTQKVIDNFANQWSKLKEEDPDEYNKKLAWHQNKLAKKKKEQDIFTANQKKITDANIAAEKALSQSYNIGQRGGGAGDSSTSHMGGISQAQADAVGKANKEAGMSGWGLKEGGIASLWRR